MAIHAFVLVSTHAHFLLSPSSAGQLAKFMQFVNANIAKQARSSKTLAPPGGRARSPSSPEQRRPSYACRVRLGRHFRQPQPPSTVVAGTIRRGFRQAPAVRSSKTLAPPGGTARRCVYGGGESVLT
jgi:hypothetical protein